MKSILVLASILFTVSANAAPVVGDMIRYKMTNEVAGQVQTMEQKMEITSINAAAGTYSMSITMFYNGTPIESHTETSDLTSATESESTLDHCSEMPSDMASLETITVAAGTFKVCHIKSEASGVKMDQYMGQVLFGLVKSVTVNTMSGVTTTFELIEMKKN